MTAPGGVALVTGGSRGIGAAVARRLAADGFAVAVNSHPDPRMQAAAAAVAAGIRASGGTAAVYPADVSEAGEVDALFRSCEAELGPVSALVLNAAVDARVPWTEITEPDWDVFMAVNLKGAFLCSRRAFGASRPGPGGSRPGRSRPASGDRDDQQRAGPDRRGQLAALRHDQGRPPRVHAVPRPRARPAGHPGQLRDAGRHQDRRRGGPERGSRPGDRRAGARAGRRCRGAGARRISPPRPASWSARTARS